MEKIRRRGGRKQTEKTTAENKHAENKIICKIMNDIRENKRILEKIREYGSTCFKSNEYPYEYIIEDEKVVFYHKITGREIGSADLELNNATSEKLTAIIEDLKRSIKVEMLVSEINNSTLTVETCRRKINALIDTVGDENKALNMLEPHLKSIAYSLIETEKE